MVRAPWPVLIMTKGEKRSSGCQRSMKFHSSRFHRLITVSLVAIVLVLPACRSGPTFNPPVPFETRQVETQTAQGRATATATSVAEATPPATATPAAATPTPTTQASQPSPTPTSLPFMTSPDYGIQAFLWWRPEVATRDLGLIKDMGFRWVKQIFAWADIEGAGKGSFDWSKADAVVQHANDEDYQIKILARVDRAPAWTGATPPNGPPNNYQDFGDFCYALASRYKGRIHAYQIWNEPNLAREWGDRRPNPEEYVRMLSIAYRRIKEADPQALVISAGLTPTATRSEEAMPDDEYLDLMYQAGFQNYCDLVGLHAAGFKAPPELSPDELLADPGLQYGDQRFFCFRHVEDMRKIMEKHGDAERQVAILEFGWTIDPRPESPYHWHAITEEQQAEYMVRAYQYAKEHWRPWIGLMNLIYIADPYWTKEREEYWWAITRPNYPTAWVRPAYDALRAMPKD